MTVKSAERRVTDELAQRLVGIGFKKKNNDLIAQPRGAAEAQIRCAVRKDKVSGSMLVSLMLGIRFEEVEKILGRTDSQDRPTLATPIDSLRHDRRSVERYLDHKETLVKLVDEIETVAVPFFDKFSNLDTLLQALQSEDPKNWFWLGIEGRIETLAAIIALRGQNDSAVTLLDREIASKQNSTVPPDIALRLRFQNLRKRLASRKSV